MIERQLFIVSNVAIYTALQALENNPATQNAYSFGQEIHVYADEITSEAKIVGLIEQDATTGKWKLIRYEFANQ